MRFISIKQYFQFLLVLLVVLLSTDLVSARLSKAELQKISNEAAHLFDQANKEVLSDQSKASELYDQVILRYQKMINEGDVKNEYVYYNMGNSYAFKGDYARAILNYKRAKQYNASFGDLLKNLEAAKRRRVDHIEAKVEEKVLKTIFFWHYDFSLKGKFWTLSVFWAISCLMLGWSIAKRKVRVIRWQLVALIVLLISMTISIVIDQYNIVHYVEGVILVDSVEARQGNGLNFPKSFEAPLHSGTEFTLIKTQNDWLFIQLVNGDEAWIPSSSAETIVPLSVL